MSRIDLLLSACENKGFTGYFLTTADEWGNEYPPAHTRRLEWLTGFTGSNGLVIVTRQGLLFATDGRYLLQAEKQIEGNWEILDISSAEFKNRVSSISGKIAFDPMLISISQCNKLAKLLNNLVPCEDKLIDNLWQGRPAFPQSEVINLPFSASGLESVQKIENIRRDIDKQADALLLTSPESIAWLLNIRANDLKFCPVLLAYALLWKDGVVELFTDNENLPNNLRLISKPLSLLPMRCLYLTADGKKIQFDSDRTPFWFSHNCPMYINKPDPCLLPKACKNEVELQGMREAHFKDGLAVTKFIYWLCTNYQEQEIDEITAANKLYELRLLCPEFKEDSFATISAFAGNGAIIHYHADQASKKLITGDGFYLIDSGGQYAFGTTDITRTIAIGNLSNEQKMHYTLVLKGHISLARAVFPQGTSGHQLDALARIHLWQHGLDYAHGTGHGVGHYLNVHESPPRIAKVVSDNYPLKKGMVVSNEPGFYKRDEYGIRIENLMEVTEADCNGFLKFSSLTQVPIDCRPVLWELLTEQEKDWLLQYNQKALELYNDFMYGAELTWFKEKFINL